MEVASASSPPPKNGPPTKAAAATANRSRNHRRRLCVCCSATVAAVLALVIIAVILSQTVFKPRRPVTTVNDVSLKDLDASLNFRSLSVDLNVTVAVDLSVRNPNRVGFRYGNSTAALSYRGEQVGEAAIPGGEISAGETVPMNVTLTIMADRLLARSQVYSDIRAGDLPLSAYTRIPGRVTVLGIFKFHIVSISSCDFVVGVSNRTVSDQRCTYKTEL